MTLGTSRELGSERSATALIAHDGIPTGCVSSPIQGVADQSEG